MTFYLPIAEIEINLLSILFFGFVVGFMSGLFGVGGGFLMTPLLILWESHLLRLLEPNLFKFLVHPCQVQLHIAEKNIDYEIGIFLLIGGIFGSTVGVILFNFLKESGNIDLIINILYVIFLSIIGILMLIESTISLVKEENAIIKKKKKRSFLDYLPLN